MNLSLVIPCYNEAKNLPLLLPRCAQLTAVVPGAEVILVDNGSCDETSGVLVELLPQFPGCRSVRVEVNRGYGFGILSGLAAAKGNILAWTHADMQTDPGDVAKGFALFATAPQSEKLFIKGRRYGRPLADMIFTHGMSVFETLLLGHVLFDVNAQPTMFHRAFFETWQRPPNDFSLDLFAYYSAKRAGLALRRFPVLFGARKHGASNWNVNWQARVKFIHRTLDYSFRLRGELGNR
jgi:glycosyltransferase involved in cell wall biosynthesis